MCIPAAQLPIRTVGVCLATTNTATVTNVKEENWRLSGNVYVWVAVCCMVLTDADVDEFDIGIYEKKGEDDVAYAAGKPGGYE